MVYGDLMLDSMVAEVRVLRFDPPLTDEELTAEIESFSAELAASASQRMTPIGEPEEVREGTAWYSFTVHEQDNGLIRETASVFTKDFGCAVALATRPQIRRGNNVGLAKRSVRSVSP